VIHRLKKEIPASNVDRETRSRVESVLKV